MYKAIFFDLDNTLLLPEVLLTEKLQKLSVNETALFSENTAREAHRQAELWTARQILHEIETNTRMDDDTFLKNVLSFYFDASKIRGEEAEVCIEAAVTDRARSQPIPEVYNLLDVLSRKYVLGVVSNNSTRVRGLLDEYDLTEYFKVIMISAEVQIEKPDPRIMFETCRKLEVEPSECLYVGDHPFDVLCCSHAGMDCAWVDHAVFHECDLPAVPKYRIKTLSELLEHIG